MRRGLIICLFFGITLFGGNVVAGSSLRDGLSAYERGDYGEALRVLRPLAEGGDPGAQNTLGQMYELGQGIEQDLQVAVHWFDLAAKGGDAQGQNNLAIMYSLGRGVPQSPKMAFRWYRRAANKGLAVAQFNLAIVYEEGWGVRKSYKEALKWYRRAAAQDLQPAQHNLALMYIFGRGVAVSYAMAIEQLRRAAAHGYAPAQNDLGMMYMNGIGMPKDLVTAHVWFALAAEQGDREALVNYRLVESNMTPEQIAEAEGLFRAWKGYGGGASHRDDASGKQRRAISAERRYRF